jgi:hypothetical protein
MRRTIVITLAILVLVLLVLGFMKNPNEKSEPFIQKVEQSHRIKLIETTILEHHRYSIIEVDGHEYISTEGGTIHSESCPCKNKQK